MMNLTPELIKKLDVFAASPEQNASKIYEHLKSWDEFNEYEILCFCVEFLGAQLLNGQLKYAEDSIKRLAKDFYFAHYLRIAEGVTKWNPTLQQDLMKNTDSILNGPSTGSDESSQKI